MILKVATYLGPPNWKVCGLISMCLCVKLTKGQLPWAASVVNTQLQRTWVEGFPPLYWLLVMLPGHFLGCWVMQKGPAHSGWCLPWAGSPVLYKNAGLVPTRGVREYVVFFRGFCFRSGFQASGLFEFLPWLPSLWTVIGAYKQMKPFLLTLVLVSTSS